MIFKHQNIKLFLFLIVSVFTISCTEIIDIDINSSDPQIVVEASLGINKNPHVWLSKTIDLNSIISLDPVENATITVSDNDGKSITLTGTSHGEYYSTNTDLMGKVGKTYIIEIRTGDKIITGNCKIPNQVPIDSFKVTNSIYPGGGPPIRPEIPAPFYEVSVKFTDPVAEKNYYRFILYLNGAAQSRNYIYDDRFTNGKQVETTLILYNTEMKSGDIISVEMQCIDRSVYEYFNSMGNSAMGPRNSSSPANPYTNLTGTLLGYFSAHTVEKREYIVSK